MKRIFYTLILMAVLFQSCLKSPYGKDYMGWRYVLGSAEKNNDISFIAMDDSTKVILLSGHFADSIVGERVYAEGEAYRRSGGFDFALDAVCYSVPTITAQFVENQNVIGLRNSASMSLDIREVWQTGKYLNMQLVYSGSAPSKHSFDFFIDNATERFENNRVTIYIFHNNGGDNIAAKDYKTLYSLNLTNLFEKFNTKFVICFVYMENKQEKKVTTSDIERN